MKLVKTDDLDDRGLDNLYSFLIKSDNISNKFNTNNIIWSIIFLRKIFNKSFKSKRSTKERAKYNYIIKHDNKIQCFFSLQYLSKDDDVNIVDLTTIIDKDYDYNTNILKLILDEFYELSKNTSISAVNILAVYIPVNIQQLNIEINNNIGFELAFQDTTTYQESNNVYYNHYMQVNDANDENNARIKKSKYNEYSKVQIIELLMNQYNVNIIVNPKKEISKKLTRKSIDILDFKVVTKNIFDIKEIQDLPEYNYDYLKVYSLKLYSFFKYLLNNKKDDINIDDFIIKRFFSQKLLFNKYIYSLYQKIYNFIYKFLNIKIFTDFILNLDYLIKMDYLFIDTIDNLYLENIINMNINKNKLLITNSLYKLNYFTKYKLDIIKIKNTDNVTKEDIKNIKNDIFICNNNKEFNNVLILNNIKYFTILITILKTNYDFLIENVNLICKISNVLCTILNSIKYLNLDGNLIIKIYFGNINIPIIKKILNFICSLFKNIELSYIPIYANMMCYLILYGFLGINDYNKKIINKLINILEKFENNEFNQNDIYNLILSNKFTYKLNLNIKNKNKFIENIEHKFIKNNKLIFYDLIGFNNKINKNMNLLISKYEAVKINYNLYNIKVAEIFENNDENNINDNIIKIIKEKYLNLFQFILDKKLLTDDNILNIIKLLKKQ